MNEQQFGNRVRQALSEAHDISPEMLARLKSARHQALEKQRLVAPEPALMWAGQSRKAVSEPPHRLSALVLSGLLLFGGLAVVAYWYQVRQNEETVEIDSAVLTGDLPIDAYLDKGFGTWLKHSSD